MYVSSELSRHVSQNGEGQVKSVLPFLTYPWKPLDITAAIFCLLEDESQMSAYIPGEGNSPFVGGLS